MGDDRLDLDVAGKVVQVNGREEDVIYSGGKGVEERFWGGGERWGVGWEDEGGREVVIEDESLGELNEWDEVTHC